MAIKKPTTIPRRGGLLTRSFWRALLLGVVSVVAYHMLVLWFEHSSMGELLTIASKSFVHRQLYGDEADYQPRVIIGDISELEALPISANSSARSVTPRERLWGVVSRIAEGRPRAIGIDIDFSPDSTWIDPFRDPWFLSKCLELNRTVPIVVGFFRTIEASPQQWLGRSAYTPLAGHIAAIQSWDGLYLVFGEQLASGTSVPSLAAKLAGADENDFPCPRGVVSSLVSSVSCSDVQGESSLRWRRIAVDFSSFDKLRDSRKTIQAEDDLGPSSLRDFTNKVVLLGNATDGLTADVFSLPGRPEVHMPGIYLHACAIETIISGRSLHIISPTGSIVLGLVAAILIVMCASIAQSWCDQSNRKHIPEQRLKFIFTVIILSSALVLAVVFVRITRVLWTEFLIMTVFLCLAPAAEPSISRTLGRVRTRVNSWLVDRTSSNRKE